MSIEYKFDEDRILKELKEYVDSTYDQHYASQGRIQVTEFIQSQLDTPDFFRGNVLKYTARYGHKEGYNRKDLMKAMHYLLMLMSYHDKANLPANVKYESPNNVVGFDPANTTWKTDKYYGKKEDWIDVANSVPVSDVLVQNVYVQMEGGKIGQMQNGVLREVGYGVLDENGLLIKGTGYRYSSEEKS